MRNSFPSKEGLQAMSLTRLRLIDVMDREEEALVQEVIREKEVLLPPVVEVGRMFVPDIKTPEEEAKWQEVVNLKEARNKELVGLTTEPAKTTFLPDSFVVTVAGEPMKSGFAQEVELKGSGEIIGDEIISQPVTEVKKPKCEFCDTKSPAFHKKGCTRPNK